MADTIFLSRPIFQEEFDFVKDKVENSKEDKIDVFISSPGGSIDTGLAISNYLGAISNKDIHTNILSNADSIATAIFLSVKKENRHAVAGSKFFVHMPGINLMMASLDESKLLDLQKQLAFEKERVLDYYGSKIPGISREEMAQMMEDETSFSAEDLRDKGVIGEVMENFDIAAFNKQIYNYKQSDMNLFKNKKEEKVPLNILNLSDEVTIAFENELKEGSEVSQIGTVEALNGSFERENMKYVIEDNIVNSVTELEVVEKEEVEKIDTEALKTEIVNEINPSITALNETVKAIQDSQKEVLEFLGKLRGQTSNFKAPVNNFQKTEVESFDLQEDIRAMGAAKRQELIEKRKK
jgi:ATP-dependent protease ClpP protease subunit